jgi:hypothetical protein
MNYPRPVFAPTGRPPQLPFFALIHDLRTCHYPDPADCPRSLDGLSPGHASLHHLLSGSAVSDCPLTGFREGRFTRQQFSLYVAACTFARAADQSPPTPSRRQARPFTAELSLTRVSPSQSLLSLLGPTAYCPGGICTRSRIKERRLHQKLTKSTKTMLTGANRQRSRQGPPSEGSLTSCERQVADDACPAAAFSTGGNRGSRVAPPPSSLSSLPYVKSRSVNGS